MNPTTPSSQTTETLQQPLNDFSNCHAGIMRHLEGFGQLPALLAPVQQARAIASDMVHFFRNAAFEHHAEEERELFPAVLRSAQPGMEKERVRHMVEALTREHRDIEKQWALLEPGLKKLAKGQPAEIDGAAVDKLIAQYQAHARYEEQEFLPLSHEILARDSNHMAALGLSLHIRHLKQGIGGHV